MILVTHLRDWLQPLGTARTIVPWGIGCTARRLAPDWAEPGDPFVGCSRNGAPVADWDALLADGDHVHYWARPGLGGLPVFLHYILIGAAAAGLLRLILPSKKPVDPGDATSPTYAFTSLRQNARGEGHAIPKLYGRHRVAPPIINEYIRSSLDSDGNPRSEYKALYLIASGPINKIGDKTADGGPFRAPDNHVRTLQINDQPAENFEGVETHVRMGNLEQTAITEFVGPVISKEVGLTMRDPEVLTKATNATDVPSGTTAIASAGSFDPSNVNITKWNTDASMVSFVGQDQAEEFTALIEFPSGLIQFDAAGNPFSNSAIYQMRYVRVDDGGTPFGNYIVLQARQVSLTRQGRLVIEDRQRTYDPALYTQPLPGLYVQSRAAAQGNPGVSCSIDTTKFTAPAPADVKFSFACWIKRRNVQAVGVANRIFQWFGTNQGFRLNFTYGGAFPNQSTIELQIGTGSSVVNVSNTSANWLALGQDMTNWHHLAVTYEASHGGPGTNTRIRFYTDGALRHTSIVTQQASWDVAAQIRLMSDSETTPTLGYDGHLDETTFWSKTLSAYDVSVLYNGGAPIGVDPATDGLLIGGEFDSNEGSSPNQGSPSFGPAAFTTAPSRTWRYGTGTNAGTDPNLSTPTAGIVRVPIVPNTPKRSKWRVDMLRLDAEDTSQRFISEMSFFAIQWRTFEQFEYPGMALLALTVPATDQLSGNAPAVTLICEGSLVPVWDQIDPILPNMPLTYSRNPAWIVADMLLDPDSGLGDIYNEARLDVARMQELATLCDTMIYDGLPRQAILTAAYLDSAAEAVTFSGVNLGQDVVRYKVAALPSHFPGVTTAATGAFIKPILTGLTPSPPAWLTTQAGLAAQEVIFVEWHQSTTAFYIYTKTTQTLGAGQTVYTVSGGNTSSNGLEIRDVRYRFDGYFDRADFDATDAIVQVLQTARAAPMYVGARFSVFIDDVGSPVALVGMGSIIEGTWKSSFQDVRGRPNAEYAEFFDETKNYERDGDQDEHPEIVDPSKQSGFRWRRMRLEGVTRRSQIKRLLRRDLNAFFLLRREVEFEMGIDGVAFIPGDVIDVAHDVPGYGISGRVWADSASTTTFKIDRTIVLESGKTYQVQIENIASELRETRTISTAAGTYNAGDTLTVGSAFTFSPDKDDEYAVGDVTKGAVKRFRVFEANLNPRTLRIKVRAIEYNEDTLDDDFGVLPTIQTSTLPAPSAPVVPPGVENLVANESTARGPDGHVRVGALVSFTHFPETYHAIGSTDVYVTRGNHALGPGMAELVATLEPDDVTVSITGFQFARDQTYTIWVVPRTRDGATAFRTYVSWVEFTPSGLAEPTRAPRVPSASVVGDQVIFSWEDDGDMDHAATVEARQGGWILGVPLFSEPAQSRASKPLPVWASAPANEEGVAETPIFFRTKLKTGQYSDAAQLDFVPAVVSADGNALEFSNEDNDWGTS